MDRKLLGIPASPGIAVGSVHLLRWEIPEVRHRIIREEEVASEIVRLHEARRRAQDRLTQIRNRVERTTGPQEAAIFDVDRHWIPEHKAVPAHWHYDVRYVVHAGDNEAYTVSEESLDLAWRRVDDLAADPATDASVRRMARKCMVRQ